MFNFGLVMVDQSWYVKGKKSYIWDIAHCIEISSFVCSSIFNFNLNFSNSIKHSKKQLQLSNLGI
jgi:hypothetical protein